MIFVYAIAALLVLATLNLKHAERGNAELEHFFVS